MVPVLGLWAQRADVLFITIDLPNTKNVKLKLEPEGKFYFSATVGSQNLPYEIDINLHDKVKVNAFEGRGKTPMFVKCDWDKWVDEDEQDEKAGADMDFGDIDFSLKQGDHGSRPNALRTWKGKLADINLSTIVPYASKDGVKRVQNITCDTLGVGEFPASFSL
ncbi:hypothetical protein LXL04_021543 [Taraxacum kok-saghyz]